MHIKYTDIVSGIAAGNWGKDYPSKEHAEQDLLADNQSLGAFAAVELLRRLDCVATSLGGKKKESAEPNITMPDDAAVFPDVNVGDRLYEYSVEEGIREFVVVAKDDENHCLMVATGDFDLDFGPATRVADQDAKATPEQAMVAGAERSLCYWSKEVDFARKLLAAADKKRSLDEFRDGLLEDEDQ